MSIRRDFPDLPPIWGLGVAALSVLVGQVLPLATLPAPATPAGWILIVVGLALIAWASLWFRRKKTTIEPRETPRHLIVEGPFRINRNPIYTGMLIALVGTGLLTASLGGILVAFAFPFIITQRFIRDEEARLRQAFGEEAERYIAHTRRW